jgi:hypothetical protein
LCQVWPLSKITQHVELLTEREHLQERAYARLQQEAATEWHHNLPTVELQAQHHGIRPWLGRSAFNQQRDHRWLVDRASGDLDRPTARLQTLQLAELGNALRLSQLRDLRPPRADQGLEVVVAAEQRTIRRKRLVTAFPEGAAVCGSSAAT